VQCAVARRDVGALWEMDTMCALPVGVRWVRRGDGVLSWSWFWFWSWSGSWSEGAREGGGGGGLVE
jgi:hypothetical protein